MPRETVPIDVLTCPLYEAGATFLAWIAYPGSVEERERRRFLLALCRKFLTDQVKANKDLASRLAKIEYFTEIDDKLAVTMIKLGYERLRDRHTTAVRYLMPFLKQQKLGLELKVGGFRITVNNMATLALSDLDMSPCGEANVKDRVFKRSRPVAHAAAAIHFWLQHLNAQQGIPRPFTHGDLLSYRDFLVGSIGLSERYRQLTILLDNPKIEDHETISFVLPSTQHNPSNPPPT